MSGRRVGDHVEMNEDEARAGETGKGVRYVDEHVKLKETKKK